MSLTTKQCKALKAQAHHLKPLIRIGQKGMTENLVKETDQTLETHELIKVHIADDDRDSRHTAATELAKATNADLVAEIGKTCILYRKKSS